MKLFDFRLAWLLSLVLGCESTRHVEPPALTSEVGNLGGAFSLGVGEHADGFVLHDGTKVDIVFEGNSTFGLLTTPGLRFTLPDGTSTLTSGLGLFELGDRRVVVERVPGTLMSPAHLKVFFDSEPLLSIKESTELALENWRDEGIGFSGYGLQHRGHLLDVIVYKSGDLWLSRATVDRRTRQLRHVKSFQAMIPTADIARKTVENLYLQEATLSQLEGSATDKSNVEVLEASFSECAIHSVPIWADVVIRDGQISVSHSGDYPEDSFEIRALRECIEKVLQERDLSDIRFRVELRYESTFVRVEQPGKSPSQVSPLNPSRHAEIGLFFEFGSATTRNEIRRAAREDWTLLLKCGSHRVVYSRAEDAIFYPSSDSPCVTDIVSQWNTTENEPTEFTLVLK